MTGPAGRSHEFRRTATPRVAEEQQRAVELVVVGAGDLHASDEVEQIMGHRWESPFRARERHRVPLRGAPELALLDVLPE